MSFRMINVCLRGISRNMEAYIEKCKLQEHHVEALYLLYRKAIEKMEKAKIIDYVIDVPLTNLLGEFRISAFSVEVDGKIVELYALSHGIINGVVNVRINSACYTGDLFGCQRCDCNEQMINAMKLFISSGNGLLIYDLSQEGRGIGAVGKLKTLKLMDCEKISTAQAFASLNYDVDPRDYSAAVAILDFFGINEINLISNNPEKINFLKKNGISVVSRIPTVSNMPEVQEYLLSKERDMGHLIRV